MERALDGRGMDHVPLFPWLFNTTMSEGSVTCRYDAREVTGEYAESWLDLIYVMSIGFRDLPEALYKLRILRHLSRSGIRIVNSVDTIQGCRNKVHQTMVLAHEGFPVPQTLLTESVHLAVDFIMKNQPCILKPTTGLQGRGLLMVPEGMDIGEVIDYVSWFQARYGRDVICVQEYVEHQNYDIRVLVVGGEVVSKMKRFNQDSWKTNIAAGAKPMPCTEDVDELALSAAEAVGGEIVGVDVLPSSEGKRYLLEVNAFPGWTGLQEITDFSIAGSVAEYLGSLEG